MAETTQFAKDLGRWISYKIPADTIAGCLHKARQHDFEVQMTLDLDTILNELHKSHLDQFTADFCAELDQTCRRIVDFLRYKGHEMCSGETIVIDGFGNEYFLPWCRPDLYNAVPSPYPYLAKINNKPIEALELFSAANRLESACKTLRKLATAAA